MRERLLQIIQYRTSGNQKDFAGLMGWTPQYLNRMLMPDGSIGLKPILTVLEKIPEVDARWLLLGEGNMLSNEALTRNLLRLVEIERYIPVMSREEVGRIENGLLDFGLADINRWDAALKDKKAAIDERFRKAYERQKELDRERGNNNK